METRLVGRSTEVVIAPDRPTVLIGERINPTGKKRLAAAMVAGDLALIRRYAREQVEAGADVIDVNVGAAGVNEDVFLAEAVQAVAEEVDVPIAVDSTRPKALEAALKVAPGRPLVNSINGEERSLSEILPLVAEFKLPTVALCMDDSGIPSDAQGRLAVARKIAERAEAVGVPREDLVVDCLALTVSSDANAALVTLEAMRLVREELGVNLTLGASNVSFGLPDRDLLNGVFLSLAIAAGLNAPIVDAAKSRQYILAADVLLAKDEWAMRYITAFRQRQA
ncbi:MAG: dihydropteroate synthase [Anaerolineae bacterium]|jgi:5-methyltetrahydrofolate--homocysteine methyltransferase